MTERVVLGKDIGHVFERVGDAWLALDGDGRCVCANAPAVALLAGAGQDPRGQLLWPLLADDVRDALQPVCRRATDSGQAEHVEFREPASQRYLEARIHPDADGVTIYFLDITERHLLTQHLLRQQQMMAQAQRLASTGSWEWDVASNHVTWSAELYRIYGVAPEQHGATFEAYLALLHPHDRVRVQTLITRAMADHQPFEFEERIVRPDHEERTLLSRGTVIVDPHGHTLRMLGACQDITERKRAAQLDRGQHDILAGIAARQPLEQSLTDIARLHETLNPGAMCSLLLIDEAGRHVRHGAAPSLPDAYNRAIDGLEIGEARGSCGSAAWRGERVVVADIASHPYWTGYHALARAHGLKACWSTPVFGSHGQLLGTFAVYYREVREPRPDELQGIDRMLPITSIAIESDKLTARLRERDLFFEMSQEIFCIIDTRRHRIVQYNPSLMRATGLPDSALTGRDYGDFLLPEHTDGDDPMHALAIASGEVHGFVNRCRHVDGSVQWLEWTAFAAPNGLLHAVARDITGRRQAAEKLAHAYSHDSVTGLPYHTVAEQALSALLARDGTTAVAVLMLGPDRFQVVNESVGHVAGDDVLGKLAARLGEVLHAAAGDHGQLARFAGDTFVAVVHGLPRAAVRALTERLRAAMALPLEGSDYRLRLTASAGISRYPEHGLIAQELLRNAEAAMHQAKRDGRDRVCEFTLEQMHALDDRLGLGRYLRDALRRDELALYFQPQHGANDRALTGFEALLRWHSPELGLVMPSRLMPVAAALGLMHEIGDWVLDAACRQIRQWLDMGRRNFYIAVNVSAQQLQNPELADHVQAALSRHDVPHGMLDIEMTENALVENVGTVRHSLARFKALGIRLALDDFGTGYSSLAYLKQFPIDKLKIDQGFVRGLPDDTADAAIVRAVITLGQQLHMSVSAEGVETASQAAFLAQLGCNELQGNYLGQALPAGEAAAFFGARPNT